MPNTTTSPNMSLPVPNVGVDPGPTWAYDLDSCLNIIDYHDHSSGYGVPVTPSGLDISSDLTFQDNNATNLKSARFYVQGSPLSGPSDLGCLYVSGVDLYYNDVSGNQVRITQSGAVVAGSGSISGLVAPASASYSSGTGTFTWQSAVNTSAKMDAGAIVIRKATLNSAGITIQANNSLSSDYSLTLPATLPGSTQFLTLDTSGNISYTTLSQITVGTGGTYATIASAISGVSAGTSILLLPETFTENVTINKNLNITGSGYGTVINGTVTFSASEITLQLCKITGNITFSSSAVGNNLINFWTTTSTTITDNNSGIQNFVQGWRI